MNSPHIVEINTTIIDYGRMKQLIERLKSNYLIPEKQGVNYCTPPEKAWTYAMSGEGAPVEDARVWRERYTGMLEDIRQARYVICNQGRIIGKTKKALLLANRILKDYGHKPVIVEESENGEMENDL